MIRVIGKKNCGMCDAVKNKLEEKGETFEYILLSELNGTESSDVRKQAMMKGIMMMPLVFVDGELVEVKDVVEL